ncbi:MAG: pyruvate kinase, partial [Saprospiraceae bacterium]
MLQHNTKIVATLGPASSSLEALEALIKEGVAIFRLNFSHGTHADHKTSIDRILSLNEKLGTHVGILADLQGPKLRIGQIENNALMLKEGDIITITNEECIGT